MKRSFLCLLWICAAMASAFAQYNTNQNKIWAFGYNAGLNFNSGSAVPFTSGIMTAEGTATVSNSAGQLLFYTDGDTVYNRNHVRMPNGTDIVPYATYSGTQAAVIAPVIGNANRYYLFSMEHRLYPVTCRLSYSIVDMTLDGGNGDVVSTAKGIEIADSLSEKMITILGNSNDVWLLTHMKDTAVFLAYRITSAGIGTAPVISNVGTLRGEQCYALGVMKASPDGRRIVTQGFDNGNPMKGAEIYDFDPGTGVVSNCMALDTSTIWPYGAEFSPDNTKLYTQSGTGTGKLYQFDISLPTLAAIKASKTEIVKTNPKLGGDLKLGPDGKIYFYGGDGPAAASEYLDRIDNPNLAGTACNYIYHAVHLIPGTGAMFSLSNIYVAPPASAGVEDMTANEVYLSPNPTSRYLSISSHTEIAYIKIFDITGREVHNEAFNSKTAVVDVSTLSEGIYIVNINGSVTRSFVKR